MRALLGLALGLVARPALAHGLHPTPLDGEDPHRGVMFDVVALDEIEVRGLAMHLPAAERAVVDLFDRPGSYAGHETDPEGWTFRGEGVLTSLGPGQPAIVELCFAIPIEKGAVHAFYLDLDGATQLTTAGAEAGAPVVEVTKGFRVLVGTALDERFDAPTTARAFNGGIDYLQTANRPPFATPMHLTTPVDTPVLVELRGLDPNGDPLTTLVTRQPAFGTLSPMGPDTWLYTPSLRFVGTDSLAFRTSDGVFDSEEEVVTFDVVASEVFVPNRPPVADAGPPGGGVYTGEEGSSVALDGSGSRDPDGVVRTWRWDCDSDGTFDVTSTLPTGRSCRYPDDGEYTLTLQVVDDGKAEGRATARVEIANVAPRVLLSQGDAGEEPGLVFVARAIDPGSDVLVYTWDFGDGGTEVGTDLATVRHVYAKPGRYAVKVIVTDDDGGQGTRDLWVEVPEE